MKAVFFLLALIGSVCALQYPVEYRYLYKGRLATGIPAIRPQVAAVGIKAEVIIQMKDKSQGLVKLSNVQVGQYNDDLQCVQLRQPVPFSYSPMPAYKSQIEEPFAVYFKEEMGNVMKVPSSDVEFITNIRKSIVEMLRVEPVIANLGGIQGDRLSKFVSGGKTPDAFSMEEETIFGRCESQYSITPVPSYLVAKEKEYMAKYLKEDAQSESSPRSAGASIPKLSDEYFRLVRAINFDKCNDRVVLQHASAANMSHLGYAQFRSVQSRSSVGTYLLKGKPGSFRVERAIVEGDIIANPYGFKTHRIQAITNQTLILEKVQGITTPMRLPQSVRPVKTWRHEVASPFASPEGHPKPWVNYHNKNDKYIPILKYFTLLGITPSQEITNKYKNSFHELLNEAVRELYAFPNTPASETPSVRNTRGSVGTTNLYWMSKIMRALPRQAINEIFSQVFSERDVNGQRKQMLLADIAAASGEAAPIKVLLEKMKSGQISHQRIASIFMTLPNNVLAPSIIPEILEYAKSLDMEREPLLTSSALVNSASLVERVCMNHKKWNYTVPNELFGREVCKPSEILSNFLPFLKQKAHSASKSWERAIYLQAISNIGSTHIIPVLKPFILGQADRNPKVRSVAIYGLAKKRISDHAREEVFDILMRVVDDLEETPELRQAAFAALLSWHPDTTWWQRMARLTWREPSQNMAAFITFTAESFAQSEEPHLYAQSRIAAFVLPLLKPFSPSMRYSYSYLYSRYSQVSKVGINFEMWAIQAMRDIVPKEIFASLNQNAGDLNLHMFDVSMTSNGLGSLFSAMINAVQYPSSEEARSSYSASPSSRDPSSRYIQDFAGKMRSHVRYEGSSDQEKEADIYVRIFDNMYQYIPINAEVISKVAGEGGSKLLRQLVQGYKVNMTKFYNPINLEYMLPTEIGLPVFGSVEMPTITLGEAELKLTVPGVSEPRLSDLWKSSEVIVLAKSNYKHNSKLIVKVEVPAPWSQKVIEAGVENLHEVNLPACLNVTWVNKPEVKNITMNVAPHTQQEFPLVHAHNIPFTQIRDMIPSKQMSSSYKVIAAQKSRSPVVKVQRQVDRRLTGFNVQLNYEGDAQYPFTSDFLFDCWRNPQRLMKLWNSPTASQWQYSLKIRPESSAKNVSVALAYLTPEGSGGSQRMPDFSPTDSVSQRMNKLKSFAEGSRVHAINAQLFFNGTEFRKYEVLMALTRKSQSQEKKEYKTMMAVMASPIPGYTQESHALCSQAELTTPAIHDYSSLKQAIQSQLEETIRGQIYHGKSCSASSISSFEGKLRASSERQSLLREEVQKICNYDQTNPLIELQTAAVYDEANLNIEFSKEKIPRSLLNLTYSIQSVIEGSRYPYAFFDVMHRGQQNKISVQAKRPLSSKGFTLWAELPEKRTIFTEIQVPYSMIRIAPWSSLSVPSDTFSSTILDVSKSHTCDIKSNSVRTYDGLKFDIEPMSCWSTAATESKDSSSILVHTRKAPSGNQEAQILLPEDNVNILITLGHATVNGSPLNPSTTKYFVKNQSQKVVAEIIKHGQTYEVIVIGKMTVTAGNTVEITPRAAMKGNLRGLCGDYDGETTYDKSGPQNCIYSDTKLFQYAWTLTEGDGCNTQKVNEMHRKVQEFQQNCKKRPTNQQSSGSYNILSSDYDQSSCKMFVYPVKKVGSVMCVSTTALPFCKPGCESSDRATFKQLAKCWSEASAPVEVKEAKARGYMTHPETAPAKYTETVGFEASRHCKRK